MSPPLLFLDFDGVFTVSVPHVSANARIQFEPLRRLCRVVVETQAVVVVSSSWRRDTRTGLGWTPTELEHFLHSHDFPGRVVGATPVHPSGWRYQEIQEYLNGMSDLPESVCILEDDFPMHHLAPWTVRTVTERLLTDAEADTAISVLKRRGPGACPPRRPLLNRYAS